VHAVLVLGPQQGGRAADVGVVVLHRHPGRAAHGLQRAEVHDRVHGVPVENGRQGLPVPDVQLVAVVQQFGTGMAADEAGPAG